MKEFTCISASSDACDLPDDFMAQAKALGWKPRRGASTLLAVLNAPSAESLSKLSHDIAGSCAVIALVKEGQGISDDALQAMLAAGVTHFLPWPSPAHLLSLTLASASALALRQGKEHDVGCFSERNVDKDALTGVMSREAARNWLALRLAEQHHTSDKGAGSPPITSCLLIGISQFDSINAAYGKDAGDAVLVRAAQRVVRCVERVVGPDAMVARMGGTEYLVVLRQHAGRGTEEMARDVARQVLEDVVRPFVAGDQVIRLTARCGIAELAQDDDAARLLRRASSALADARRSGTSPVWFRSGSRRRGEGVRDSDRLDADLRLALDRGEIGIVYQPQYDSNSDEIVGVEALARWNHPELGTLDAGTLFAAADRSDYLLPLSMHIQRAALMEAGQWTGKLRDLRLSINVTAVDLAQKDFAQGLLEMVKLSGFPADHLTVEITESGLIENIDSAAQILHHLHEHHLRIAIDDFGTGYSSLAYLKALHPDYLKIDHSLSRDILGTSRDRVILRAIIAMARSLALTVIAEGVESEEQLLLLAREGCDIYQGFLRSAAVSSAELEGLVSKA